MKRVAPEQRRIRNNPPQRWKNGVHRPLQETRFTSVPAFKTGLRPRFITHDLAKRLSADSRETLLPTAKHLIELSAKSSVLGLKALVPEIFEGKNVCISRQVFIDLCLELAAQAALQNQNFATAIRLSLALRANNLFVTKESAFAKMKNLPAELIEEQLNHSKGIRLGIDEADLTTMILRSTKTNAEACLARGDKKSALDSVLTVLAVTESYFNCLFNPDHKNDVKIAANIKLDDHGEISEPSLVYIQDLARMDAAIRAAMKYCSLSSVNEIRHLEARFKQMQTQYMKFVEAIFVNTKLNLRKPLLNCLPVGDIDSHFLRRVATLLQPKKAAKQVTVDLVFINALVSAARLLQEWDLNRLVESHGALNTFAVNKILDHVAFSPSCTITKEDFVKLLQAFRANRLFASEASAFISKRGEHDKELRDEALAHLNRVELEL